MGIDDIVDKAKKLIGDGGGEANASEQPEEVVDQVFDPAADLAEKISPQERPE